MTKTYIGIDLGHGETSAAFPQEKANNEYSVVRLNTAEGNMQVIPTQIILTNEQMKMLKGKKQLTYDILKTIGPFRIGECPSYVPDGERFFYFKVAPKDFDTPCGITEVAKDCGITHGMVMACYVYALVENIFFYNQDVLLQNKRFNVELLIGCPTTKDWTESTFQTAYTLLVKWATGIQNVRIIPESRAAIFSSVENNVNSISASRGAVVFDFGSSTADCTYMLLGRKILEFSWTLGAYMIERTMMLQALEKAMQEDGLDPDEEKLLEVADALRKSKEAYYNGMFPPKGKSFICEFQEAGTGDIMETPIKVDSAFMDRVTGAYKTEVLCDSQHLRTGSWRELCREFFIEARQQIEAATYKDETGQEQHCSVSTVVLTGGASKMDFIESLCKEVYPDCTVSINKFNPSHTVSNGLAWIAVTDSNLPACKKAAVNQVMNSGVVNKLSAQLTDEVFECIKQIAVKEVKAWAEQPGDTATLAELKEKLVTATSLPATKNQIRNLCDKVIADWKKQLSTELERAVNAQAKKLYSDQVARSLMLPKDILKELDSSTLSMDIDTQKLLDGIDFNSSLKTLFTAIIKLTIWIVAAILAVETFGLSLLVAWFVSPDDMSDTDMNKPRTQATRQRICTKIDLEMDKNKQEIMKNFTNDLEKQTTTLEKAVEPMVDAALAVVTLQQFSL